MIAAARRPATPYARRLARERGLALTAITGSGPGGRIVAADIAAFVPAPTPEASPASGVAVSAFAATIDLGKVKALLEQFGDAAVTLTLDDLLLRAAALALEVSQVDNAGAGSLTIGWETGDGTGRRETVLADAHKGLVSALHARLAEASPEAATTAVLLSVRRVARAGIRPVAMPLLPHHAMRLVISASDADPTAECLLCFDASSIGEDEAATLLAHFRTGIEIPLRLLA